MAIITNLIRITSVYAVATVNPQLAASFYHDYSDYVIYGVGLSIMVIIFDRINKK